jgi:hypothetical protein
MWLLRKKPSLIGSTAAGEAREEAMCVSKMGGWGLQCAKELCAWKNRWNVEQSHTSLHNIWWWQHIGLHEPTAPGEWNYHHQQQHQVVGANILTVCMNVGENVGCCSDVLGERDGWPLHLTRDLGFPQKAESSDHEAFASAGLSQAWEIRIYMNDRRSYPAMPA